MALSYSLTRIVEPTSSTASIYLDEALAHCRLGVDQIDDEQLGVLAGYLLTAREVIEDRTGLSLLPQQWRLSLPEFADRMTLPRPPLVSVQSVKYLDDSGTQQTLSASNYVVHTAAVPGFVSLAPSQSWPSVQAGAALPVTIEYTAGYADIDAVPLKAKQAILLLVSHWYEHRTAVVPGGMNEIPLAFESLVKQLNPGTG